jgi:acetyl-CoA synthetase
LLPQVYAPFPLKDGDDQQKLWDQYRARYERSIQDPDQYWDEMAKENLHWFAPYTRVRSGDFIDGDIEWFHNGKLNAAYNCIDRHLPAREHKVAVIWEGDEIGENRHITYGELAKEVAKVANVFKQKGAHDMLSLVTFS